MHHAPGALPLATTTQHLPGMSMPDLVRNAPKAAQRDRIPIRVKRACELLVSGEVKTIKSAAEHVNLSREHLGKMLAKPHVQAFFDRATRQTIARAKMRAGARLVQLIDAESEHVSKDAAIHVLRIEGIAPPESGGTQVNVNVSPGYIIDLSDGPVIEHQVPDAGKPMIGRDDVGQG
jgi:hypothetical protein